MSDFKKPKSSEMCPPGYHVVQGHDRTCESGTVTWFGKSLFICKRESHFDPKKEHFDWTFVWYSKKGKQAAAKEYCEFYDTSKQIVDWKRTFADIPPSIK